MMAVFSAGQHETSSASCLLLLYYLSFSSDYVLRKDKRLYFYLGDGCLSPAYLKKEMIVTLQWATFHFRAFSFNGGSRFTVINDMKVVTLQVLRGSLKETVD